MTEHNNRSQGETTEHFGVTKSLRSEIAENPKVETCAEFTVCLNIYAMV